MTGVGEGDLCGVIEFAPGDIESVFRALNRLGEEPRYRTSQRGQAAHIGSWDCEAREKENNLQSKQRP